MKTLKTLEYLQHVLSPSSNAPGRMDTARSLCDKAISELRNEEYQRSWKGRWNRFWRWCLKRR